MFEKATRLKLTFETRRGAITVIDLWDVPLTSKDGFDLDTIAKGINKQLKETAEESFVAPIKTAAGHWDLRMEIVKHVIAYKLELLQARELAEAKRIKKAKIMELISSKKDDSLAAMSEKELLKELEGL